MVRSIQGDSIPRGWKYDYLDNFAVRGSGHTPNKNTSEYWNGGVKWVSLSDSFNLDKGFISETDKEISDEGIKKSSAVIHPAGTVILSRDAGVGKSAVLASPMAVSQHFMAWRCDNSSKMNSWFLYHWLQVMKPEFERHAVGSTIKTIGLPYFKKLKIAVPPYSEQKKISKLLLTWDQSITLTAKLLENIRQQKKALTHQLLSGSTRFDSQFKSWPLVRLGNLFFERAETGLDYLPLLSITSEEGVIDRSESGRKDTSNADKSKYLRICPGDIGYNTMRMWQGVSGLSALEGLVSPAYTVLSPQEGMDPLFSAYLFKLPALVHTFYRNSQGMVSDTWNLKYSHFAKIQWRIPELEEQKAIAAILFTADKEIQSIQAKLACLKQEKKALMQQLLTGKRRVKVDAVEAGADEQQ